MAMLVAVTGCSLEASPAGSGGVGERPPSLFRLAPSINGLESGCDNASFGAGGGKEFSEGGFEFELVSFVAAAAAAVSDVVMTVAPMPCRRASTLQNLQYVGIYFKLHVFVSVSSYAAKCKLYRR